MTKLFKYWLCAVFMVLCLLGGGSTAAYAAEIYTGVLEDLTADSSFDVSAYPEKADDYTLSVIQIAESSGGELFVYVYQPSKRFKASSINISTAINDNLKYINYDLVFLSSSETLYKYKVSDLTVKNDVVRYYDISNIYRPWVEGIDPDTGNDNTVNEVPNAVGQLWTAVTLDGEVSYGMTGTETIEVTDKYVDFLRYRDGVGTTTVDMTDSHYVAFSTDKDIDRLMEADVYYVARSSRFTIHGSSSGYEYGEPEEKYVYLTADDSASNPGGGIFGHKFTWERIQSVDEFIETEDLTDEAAAQVKNKEWVLRFAETSVHVGTDMFTGTHIDSTEVTEVTILRLKFETDGVVYNLGVVDNKQSGDDVPGNNPYNPLGSIPWWVWALIALACLILIAVIVNPVASLLLLILKGVWWIVSAPFRFIGWIVRKIKDGKET